MTFRRVVPVIPLMSYVEVNEPWCGSVSEKTSSCCVPSASLARCIVRPVASPITTMSVVPYRTSRTSELVLVLKPSGLGRAWAGRIFGKNSVALYSAFPTSR
jgi:hypothetical protein